MFFKTYVCVGVHILYMYVCTRMHTSSGLKFMLLVRNATNYIGDSLGNVVLPLLLEIHTCSLLKDIHKIKSTFLICKNSKARS